jgi:penicillin amidase
VHADLPTTAAARGAAELLLAWDGQLLADSPAALLFEAWWAQLQQATREALLPAPLRHLIPLLHPHAAVGWTVARLQAGSADAAANWAPIDATLARAWEHVQALPRAADRAPAWGDVHRVDLRHELGRWLQPQWGEALHATGGRSGGDAGTVQARWYASLDRPRVTGGASFRAVVDVGDWEGALAINLPGQSGDPRSPWYRNLYERWVAGTPMPLPFGPDAVRARSVQQLIIKPQPAPGPGERE